ncbi:MAG: TonB family protein [Sphingobacteriales bacterium]|nr:MAG: TonB family protein [Sphingobacteriales bacterium]
MNKTDQPLNIKAAAWTISIHILLLLIFMLFRYSLPAATVTEELGMEVNLGTSDEGSGTDQPMSTDNPSAGQMEATYQSTAAEQSEARNMMTSDDPDAPAVAPVNASSRTSNSNSRTTVNPHRSTSQQPNANSNQRQQPRYVYQGGTGAGGNSAVNNVPGSSEGNTTGTGDRGVPGGTPGSSNYTGSPGNGTGGISHTLSGRDISPRQFVAEFSEGGKVVVRVKVDRDGNIISRTIKSSSNRKLNDIALQKLSQAKFSRKPDAAPEQIGDISFIFKTRKQ